MATRPSAQREAFELRVTLLYVEPPVWRRVRLPIDSTLAVLHEVLQVAFGWKSLHVHQFLVGDVLFSLPDLPESPLCVDVRQAPLAAVAHEGSSFVYQYDLGDDWVHEVLVERVLVPEPRAPRYCCLDGARSCPPEDCGGPAGYAQLLRALADPRHPEHEQHRAWVGRSFSPDSFDRAAINKKLAALKPRRPPT